MSTPNLSSWSRLIAPSPTLAVTAKAKALRAEGKDVCSLSAGEPDFDTPGFIKEACIAALQRGETKYTPAAGLPALCEAVTEKYARDNDLPGLQPHNVVISPGGKFSCYLAVLSVVSPGDEVIIPAPYWVSYPEMVKLAGGTPVIVDCPDTQNFRLTPEQLRAAATERSRMVILNSPSNPTGVCYSRAELEALTETALSLGLYIMSDEMYEYLLYEDATHNSPASFSPEAFDRVITVGGFSKTFSMTGWRLGTLVANKTIAKACSSIQSQTSSNPTTFAQYGALAALQNWDKALEAIQNMRAAFDRRRKRFCDGLNAIDGISCYRSRGAFYLFPNIGSFGLSSMEFADKLLGHALTASVPGLAFGADAHIRVSYACDDATIETGLERIERFTKTL